MDIESLRAYCIAKTGVAESFPFDDTSLVLKVADKIFAILSLDTPPSINLKCDPERAIELRAQYPEGIAPGYHMNKQHWNTLRLDTGLTPALVRELVDHSYQLVVDSLPRKKRALLEGL